MIIPFLSILIILPEIGWSLPLVDPGLFVISGVQTCGNGKGYCLLGSDCRLNQDFEPDPAGHCSGLKGAFTPSAHFVCCTSPQANNELTKPAKNGSKKPPPSYHKPSQPPVELRPQNPSNGDQPPTGNLPLVQPSKGNGSEQLPLNVTEQPSNSGSQQSTSGKPGGPNIDQVMSQPPNVKLQQSVPSEAQKNDSKHSTTEQPQMTTSFSDEKSSDATTISPPDTTIAVGHQTITSPPDYIQVDSETTEDAAENSVDWEGVKNISEVLEDFCPSCNSQAVFSLDGASLCLGTHLRHGWVLTSGSCALRIFRAGMIKVVGKYLQDPEILTQVKTISVHEDYRPYTSNILHPEPNNIGLVLLSSEPKKACSPCIPDKEDKFAGKLCSTTLNSTALSIRINNQEKEINDDVCESVVETMQGEGTEDFYTVACDSSDSRYNGEDSSESGKGLTCRGYIAGIETGSGTGLAVFTKVSQYSEWITANMMQDQRQTFDTIGF